VPERPRDFGLPCLANPCPRLRSPADPAGGGRNCRVGSAAGGAHLPRCGPAGQGRTCPAVSSRRRGGSCSSPWSSRVRILARGLRGAGAW